MNPRERASRTCWLAAAMLLATLPMPGAAAAQAEEARVHERRARQLFRARDYEAALEELEQERRLDPTPDVVFRVALCLDRLHRPLDAHRAYSEYLSMTAEDGPERVRVQAERALRRIERRVASVRITSDPAGAGVYVDDAEGEPAATTPAVLAVEPGEHRLILRLDGHRPHEATIEAARGAQVELAAELAPDGGVLVVEGPEGARVSVRGPDGAEVGEGLAPLRLELAPGTYEAALATDGDAAPAWRALDVSVGETTTATLSLERPEREERAASDRGARRPAATGRAELRVAANPEGALVFLDGREVGVAPLALPDVRAGRHALRLEADGVETWRGRVELEADEEVWVTAALTPPPGTEHSAWSYVALGTGGAAVLAAIFTGIVSISMREDFEELTNPADPMPASGLREQGVVVNGVTDALWIVGSLGVAAGILLYVLTETPAGAGSSVTVTRGSR